MDFCGRAALAAPTVACPALTTTSKHSCELLTVGGYPSVHIRAGKGPQRNASALTEVLQVDLAAVGRSHSAANTLHPAADHLPGHTREMTEGQDMPMREFLLRLWLEGAGGACDLHQVRDHVHGIAAADGAAAQHCGLQRVLKQSQTGNYEQSICYGVSG